MIFYYLFFVISILSTCYYFFAIYSARQFFVNASNLNRLFYPPITILKPVCGIESGAYENFASFCRQTYPIYQLIFGVKDINDPIVSVINNIIVNFPHIDIQLLICNEIKGANPKINSLIAMQKKAKYPFLLISDSDVRVGPTYLSETIRYMSDLRVGVVTCLFRSIAAKGASVVEAISYATEFFPGAMCARQLAKVKWTCGASILIRQEVLTAIGGVQVLANYIAEDHLIGKLVTEKGYRIVLSNYIIEHVLQTETLLGMIRRKIRWQLGILAYDPAGYLSLIFTYGTVFSLLFLVVSHLSALGGVIFLMVWVSRLIMSWVIGVYYLNDKTTKQFFWFSPLQDFYSFTLWFLCLGIKKVHWKENSFKIGKKGKLIRY